MADSNSPGRIAPAFIACAAAAAAHGAELTIDRLFDAPPLSGATISGLKFSPDGSRITFLRGNPADKDRLDLWQFTLADQRLQPLVEADVLQGKALALSDEERSRRERQRTAAFSGILEYSFAPSGHGILFPLNGRLYFVDLAHPGRGAIELTSGTGFATDAAFSPRGGYVAYIRDQNLWIHDFAHADDKPLTSDGGGTVKNGVAEFVAQEEMGRNTGYWWSPDELHIAFARVDESPIAPTQRFEITADNVASFAQRYPVAGGPNVAIRLAVTTVSTGATTWIDLGPDPDFYLARVDWLPDGKTLAIQRESRDQRRLDLLFADIDTGNTRLILTETSDSWIELNDELSFLKHTREFIWRSSRDGFAHLYLYDDDGHLKRRLTSGAWNVDALRGRAIKAIDEKSRLIYFVANAAGPATRNLYAVSLDTGNPSEVLRLSSRDGVHSITVSPNHRYYVDQFTSVQQPPQVSLHAIDGRLIAYVIENRLDGAHPDAPYLADNAVPEFGTLTAEDGQTLEYRLFKPLNFDASKRYPAIVDVYGGPGVQRVLDEWTGSSFTQILTRAGYVVFQLDNRGSGFRGSAFQAPIRGRLGAAEVADQVRGARWLGAQNFIDPARIGVWGWSYGGYMTLMLMFKAPDMFRAGVSGAPVTDWTLYDTHYTERYLGRPQDNAAGYEASSVLPYAHALRGKLLVMHGMADDNVLFLNSTKLFRKLQDLGLPFDVMVYPGAKHGLLRQHDGRHAYAAILRFFDSNLRPQPSN
jgi:dipeptidyl-peptidase-4